MKDIDFDELDRAVSSLMGSVPNKDAPADASQPSTAGEPTAHASDAVALVGDQPHPSLPTEGTSFPDAPAEPEPASPQPASRGRFMDMVRPGVKEGRKPFPASAVSRQGTTLQPAASSSRMTTAPDEVANDTEDEETPMPDIDLSIAMQDLNALETMAPEPVTTGTLEIPSAPDVPTSHEPAQEPAVEEVAPLSSPFLADAKVEKRPLGRPVEAAPAVELTTEPSEEVVPAPSVESFGILEPISPNDTDAQLPQEPLPAELGSELLSLETTEVAVSPDTPEVQPTPEVVAPVQTSESVPAPTASPQPPVPLQSIAAASIPQQYKVQPETNQEAPVGGIYDAQPLAHPAKGKPGWLWIVAIVLILVLGAGGGAAIYYLGLL